MSKVPLSLTFNDVLMMKLRSSKFSKQIERLKDFNHAIDPISGKFIRSD